MTAKEAISVLGFVDSVKILNDKPYINIKEISKIFELINKEDEIFISLDCLKKYLKDFNNHTTIMTAPTKQKKESKKNEGSTEN